MRPSPGQKADLVIFATMFQDTLQLFRDVSGTSLHKRGYRTVIHKAALNEAAAAGILYMAGWPEVAQKGAFLASSSPPLTGLTLNDA
jgi:23S rRNA G2445 N2-methylase RlmL